MSMEINISNPFIKFIAKIAKKSGFKVYVVGGYLRDKIMGIESSDIDFMVEGDAIEFAKIAAKESGTELSAEYKNFGTALLMYKGSKLEFSSARKESYNRDSRKPIVELSSITDDLARRDFTVNALALNLNEGKTIIDLFNGLDDIENKILRTPLEPQKTFDDDPLRILRGIRFASKLNFSIHPETFEAMHLMADRLKDKIVSQERITNEFLLTLATPKPSIGIELAYLSGVMQIIFPEISNLAGVDQTSKYHHKDVFYHTLQVLDKVALKSDNIWLRLAALLHDVAKPQTKKFVPGTGWTFHGHAEIGARMLKKIFTRLRLPMQQLPYVEKLVRLHLRPIHLSDEGVTDSAIRRLAAEAGEELEDLLTLCRADITSKNTEKIKSFLSNYDILEKRILEVQEKDNLRNFQSPVRGEEIMSLFGLAPSKTVGRLKKAIEEAILDGIIPNEYEAAKGYLLKIKDDILKDAPENHFI